MITTLRWVGFALGVGVTIGTVIAVIKTLIVPRRSWSLITVSVGRLGYRIFHRIAGRMRSYDLADRFLGFQAPLVIVGILVSLLFSFVIGYALMLLPWADLSAADALRESGSSVFTLGFISTGEPIPTTLDVSAGATGMIFVALTIGYLPTIYGEVKAREALVRQLAGWTGAPSWGPEILARFSLAGAVRRLPRLYETWDTLAARIAETHIKYPVLTHFRLPRSKTHWLTALLAVTDAAALDMALRPDRDHAEARMLLRQVTGALSDVAYPMRRVRPRLTGPGITRENFENAIIRLEAAGFPIESSGDDAWEAFGASRKAYAPVGYDLAYWVLAAPAPWSGERHDFPGLQAWPDQPTEWTLT
jgi:hypothetical protein